MCSSDLIDAILEIRKKIGGNPVDIERIEARWEYLRALRYELGALPKVNRVQVCSRDNGDYLLSFLPQLEGRIDDGVDVDQQEGRRDRRADADVLEEFHGPPLAPVPEDGRLAPEELQGKATIGGTW